MSRKFFIASVEERGEDYIDDNLKQCIVEPETIDETMSIDNPYDPKLIDIRPQTLALVNIIRRLQEDAIDLYPDFQRSANLWNAQRQSLLIESILIRIPLPAFYFDGTNNDKWQVIDGLQRLCALKNFVVTKELKLTGLEYINQLSGCTYNDLPSTFQRQIEETNIMAYIMNVGNSDVKYNIFKRINTGGVTLNPQEIRNALNQGIPADFIAELADTDAFKNVAHVPVQRMQDKEFVTRFITFYICNPEEYRPDLDTFMSNAVRQLSNKSQSERNSIKHNFIAAMETANCIFGKWAFRKVFDKNEARLYPINKSLFEVWSVLLSKLSPIEQQILNERRTIVFDSFLKLLNEDSNFLSSITSQTGHKATIKYRFFKIDELIKNILL